MENRVISLSSAQARRKHIANTFGARGIPFRFFDALMPSEELNRAMEELVPGLAKQHLLSEVEKACFMSHVVLWKQALDEGLPYVAVFEDDVLLGENAEKFLAEDAWLEERFAVGTPFIVRLETMFMPIKTETGGIKVCQERVFDLLCSEHWGTAGYIVSCEAMQFFLERFACLPTEKIRPIDWMMFSSSFDKEGMPVYQLNPAVCAQELHYAKFHNQDSTLGSLLESERCEPKKTHETQMSKRTLKERLIHVLTKISREKKKRQERREKMLGKSIVPFR